MQPAMGHCSIDLPLESLLNGRPLDLWLQPEAHGCSEGSGEERERVFPEIFFHVFRGSNSWG